MTSNPPVRDVLNGMRQAEVYAMARRWWNSRGRKLVNQAFNEERISGRFVPSGAGPAFRTAGRTETVLPSGILRGLPWNQLQVQERARVARVWHYFNVVKRDVPEDRRGEDERLFADIAARLRLED